MTSHLARLTLLATLSFTTACAVDTAASDDEIDVTPGGKADGSAEVEVLLTKAHPSARLRVQCNDPIATCLADVTATGSLERAEDAPPANGPAYVMTLEVVRDSDGASAVFEQYFEYSRPGQWFYRELRHYNDIDDDGQGLTMSSWHGNELFKVKLTRERWAPEYTDEVRVLVSTEWK